MPSRLVKYDNESSFIHFNSIAPARPLERLKLTTDNLKDRAKSQATTMRQPIRSLIPPELASEKSNITSALPSRIKRRNSETSISIKSIKSCNSVGTSRRRIYEPKHTLATIPSEILDLICMHLEQTDLLAIMRTNSNLTESATTVIYMEPSFATTYRYAQFAYTVSHKKHYADMVRILNVSHFGGESHEDRKPQAGWREWKYRDSFLHQANRNRRATQEAFLASLSSHPPPNPLLDTWSLSRDLPIGGLCHTLIACSALKVGHCVKFRLLLQTDCKSRKVDISRLQLSSDFTVRHPGYPATTWTRMVYVSDIQRSWTWEPEDLKSISDMYIIDQIRNLEQLDTFTANHFISLSTLMAQQLLYSCPQIKWVDFRESGMKSEQPWTVKGTREDVVAILKRLEEATPKSPDGRN